MFTIKTLVRTGAALGATAALAFGASPAMADGNGATVINQSGCQAYGWVTVCGTQHSEGNVVTTPSGNTNFEGNGKFTYTVTFTGGVSYTSTGSFHYHELIKPGGVQEFSDHYHDTVTVSGYGTCTYSVDLHYANGQYQFHNFNYACTP
ncbi:hypothetical protein GCM10027405_05520 [Arthrobacter alkaliphilus]|uniref:hypothetical protein n=1 Tax=Arthrobacter alkaliphilus TaxID=369936 RepID=UPI001F429C6B|nr:hypothetical protein [Arthrobacter alkaliphilus]